jgi:hypothetical protein
MTDVDQLRSEVRRISTKALRAQVDSLDHGADLAGLADDDHTQYLTSSRHALEDHDGGDVVYSDNGDTADIDIASTTYVTIKTTDVADVAVGDTLQAELHGIFFNNSGANRTYTLDADFDAAFANESGVTVGWDATGGVPLVLRWVIGVAATDSAYYVGKKHTFGITDRPPGVWYTITSGDSEAVWDSAGSDLTGTVTVNLRIKSSDATATQGFRVVSFVVRKVSST